MKKFNRVIAVVLVLGLCMMSFAACGSKEEASEANTVATKLQAQFKEEIAKDKDLASVADKLIQNKALDGIAMGYVDMEEGYLNGFDGDVTGFNQCIYFAPFIGTIPFVGYLFETDDAAALMEKLDSQSRLDWNICTMADEKVIDSVDNIVFFVMAPNSFEE